MPPRPALSFARVAQKEVPHMLAKLLTVLIGAALLLALGCSSDREKGINSGRDRPKAADKGGN